MNGLKDDLRFILRSLSRRPTFAATCILTLALGLGANVAVFSTVYGVLLRPLPYPEPDRLTVLWANWAGKDIPRVSHTGGDFKDYRRSAKTFQDLAAVGSVRQNITGGEEPLQVQVGWVSENFFSVLGIEPALGRDFSPQEGPRSLILSDGFWRRYFGGSREVLGRTVELDGQPFTIVGILPRDFQLYMSADVGISTAIDVWKPPDEVAAPQRWVTQELALSSLRIIGRLATGYHIAQAQEEMDGIAARLRETFPDHAEVDYHITVKPLAEEVVGHIDSTLFILQGAVGLVLLIACLNVANLLLVRTQYRRREFAIRDSLGGGPGRLARLVFLESMVLAFVGGAFGLGLALLGIRLLRGLDPAGLPRLEGIGINAPVLVFSFFACLLTAFVAGIVPIMRLDRRDVGQVLRQESHSTLGQTGNYLAKALIVVEVGMSVVLLLITGLLLRSFLELQKVRPGFDPENLLTFSISLPGVRYQAPGETADFLARLEDGLRQLPGVRSVATVWPLPLEGQIWYAPYELPDQPAGEAEALTDFRIITPHYPETMGTRLLAGRLLWEEDENAVLIDQSMAERNWPDRSPVGQRLRAAPNGPEVELTVVGVVENIRHQNLTADGRETVYLPAKGWSWTDWELCLVVRTESDPRALIPPVRQVLRDLDSGLPMAKVRTMQEYVADATASNAFAFLLMLIFALVALVLATVGLYGVVSYSLSQKVREIGLRMALGAMKGQILGRSLLDGLLPAAIGLALGTALSFPVTRLIGYLLYGVGAHDPGTYLAVLGLLAGVGLSACYVPARRAVSTPPTIAMRAE